MNGTVEGADYMKGNEREHRGYVVLGIFQTRRELENCVSTLEANGFQSSDVSALLPTPDSYPDITHEASSKAPEGVTGGAAAGAALGGALGWLAGIGAIAIPGIGPFIAAGPIMAALAGIGIGSTVGGVAGGLIGLGIPEYEAKRYEGQVQGGGILLSVHCENSDWCDKAEDIMERCGATDISSSSAERSEPSSSSGPFPWSEERGGGVRT
jgi:hypothetical protein